ncbi:MAG: hypothetical protein WBD44_02720, partial [Phycisphaerae bacterium]
TAGSEYTVTGAGPGFPGNGYWAYRQVAGDFTLIAKVHYDVGSVQYSESGLLFSTDTDNMSGPPHNTAKSGYVNLSLGWQEIDWGWRDADGGATGNENTNGSDESEYTLSVWLKLVRVGDTFSGYYYYGDTPGTWTQVSSSKTWTGIGDVYVGLFASSQNPGVDHTMRFQNLDFVPEPSPQAQADPFTPTAESAIGIGTGSYTTETAGYDYLVTAAGGYDHDGYWAYQKVAGDFTLIAKVHREAVPPLYSRSGLLFSTSTSSADPKSGYLNLFYIYDGYQLNWGWRGASDSTPTTDTFFSLGEGNATDPVWLKLVRAGDVFSAYYSYPAGDTPGTWTEVGSSPKTWTGIGDVYVGLKTGSQSSSSATTHFQNLDFVPEPATPMPASSRATVKDARR